jgi:hypothetical protein
MAVFHDMLCQYSGLMEAPSAIVKNVGKHLENTSRIEIDITIPATVGEYNLDLAVLGDQPALVDSLPGSGEHRIISATRIRPPRCRMAALSNISNP